MNLLTCYPFLAVNGRRGCWHPQVHFRRIEGMVHVLGMPLIALPWSL